MIAQEGFFEAVTLPGKVMLEELVPA